MHALTLLIEQRLILEVAHFAEHTDIRVLPPLCPLSVSSTDFRHGALLIERARTATERWLDEGGPASPTPSGSCPCTATASTSTPCHGGRGRMTITDITPDADRAPHLELIRGGADIDLGRAERAVADLLVALGQDLDDEHTRDTPRRVAAAYAEMLTPRSFNLTTFPNDEGYDELVLARDIPFHSLCQHHMLPFKGVAHVGYLPGDRILGLSKLARVVELFARGLQVQERLTKQVADWLQDQLAPQGRRRRPRGRAPLHVAARRPGRRVAHRHLRAPRAAAHGPPVPRRVLRAHRGTNVTRRSRRSDHPLA